MVKIKCQVCGQVGLLQRVGKNYCRIRHYLGVDHFTKTPKFSYCQQSLEYVEAQLRSLNGKDLFQSNQSNIATGCIDPELDQKTIDPKQSNSSSEPQSKRCRGSLAWLWRQTHKASFNIDWSRFRQWLVSKYSKSYASSVYSYSIKYCDLLENVNDIQFAKDSIRNNIINALIVLSRYLGEYEKFKATLKAHGIKKHKADTIEAFLRIFNSNAHDDLGKWYQQALAALNQSEATYLKFMLLSGIRKDEGAKAFNKIIDLTKADKLNEYFNEDTGFLEHFKYPKEFLRNTKNVYVTAVPKDLIIEITKSSKVSYAVMRKKLSNAGLRMRLKQLRSFYATRMRELGLLQEQGDLCQGRLEKSVFLQHYFKQNPKILSDKILSLLPKLETLLS
jgi:intergrase/recombinase